MIQLLEEEREKTEIATDDAMPGRPVHPIEFLFDVGGNVFFHAMLLERLETARGKR